MAADASACKFYRRLQDGSLAPLALAATPAASLGVDEGNNIVVTDEAREALSASAKVIAAALTTSTNLASGKITLDFTVDRKQLQLITVFAIEA